MQIEKFIIANARIECLKVTLDTESGTLNLKDGLAAFPGAVINSKGSILRVFTKYTSDSSGESLDLHQDGEELLALDDAEGTFTSKNDIFEKRAMVFCGDDVLTLVYDVSEEVIIKIYTDMQPHL